MTDANKYDSAEHGYPLARIFAQSVKMLEYNPSKVYPWLTVDLAEEEIVIQQVHAESEFVDDYGNEVVRG